MIKDSLTSYGIITRAFHWILSSLMIITIIWGFMFSEHIVDMFMDRGLAFYLHKSAGITILLIVLPRIFWRLTQQTPLLVHVPAWQRILARTNILFLYGGMVLFPLSGIAMGVYKGFAVDYFSLFTFPALEKNMELAANFHSIHVFLAYAILVSVAAHIGGALYHYFIIKDNVLQRMLKSH